MSTLAMHVTAQKNDALSVHKVTLAALLITAVFGYVISYGKLYAFHLVLVAYWFFVAAAFISVKKEAVKAMGIPVLFLAFMLLGLLWAPSLKNGLTFVFYFLCGYTLVFAITNYASDFKKLNFVFRVCAFFFLLNFFVGWLETTGYFRLPVSPYYGLSFTRPSGFNSNLNNFGFVFVAIFPFLFLHPKRLVKIFALAVALWFTFKLESKGFFLGLFAFFLFFTLVEIKKKSTWRLIGFALLISILATVFIALSPSQVSINNQAFSAFDQIERGVDLILSGDVEPKDSTSKRSFVYLLGVKELIASNGLGLGAAGIGTKLARETNFFGDVKDIYSFHNFFLEMLVDIGVIPFTIAMFAYLKLAVWNIKTSRKISNEKQAYFAKASGLSLLTIIPASISPSSIIYVFTFWMVLGFAVANYLVSRRVPHA